MIFFRVANKFRTILSKRQKRKLVILFFMMVIAGFMEMLSVSLMLPFVEAVMNPGKVLKYGIVSRMCGALNVADARSFLVILSLLMVAVYLVKNAFLLFQIAMQNKFVNQSLFETQQKLLKSVLSKPYESFLEIQSGEVIRIIGTDTVSAFGILTHILTLLTELVVSVTLLITVLIISPIITVGMGLFLVLLVLGIQRIIRPVLRNAGENHQKALAGMNKWILQAVQGVKEIKLMGSEEYFEKRFRVEGEVYVSSTYRQMTLSAVPKYFIEALTMGAFFVVVAIMFINGAEADAVVPVLSSIAMAAIRLLPATSRISGSLAGIVFGEPAVDKLIENLVNSSFDESKELGKHRDKQHAFNNEIRIEGVRYKYPTGEHMVLVDADLEIKKGASVGIIGASGSGKTTAVDLILGLLKPSAGKITVDGKDIQSDYDGWISHIGYIPQSIFLLDSDIRENVAFGVPQAEIDDRKVWTALKEAALDTYVKGLPKGIDTEVGERGIRLSGGQRQRLGIARALYFNPDVLVFDEATSALDNDTENVIMESISSLQGTKTLIIIAHRLSTIEGCDHVYRVDGGKIIKQR